MSPPEMIGARVAGEPLNIINQQFSSARQFSPSLAANQVRRSLTQAGRRSQAYSALLLADGYCEEARQALLNGDDAAATRSLAVIRGLAEAALTQIDRQVRR